MTPTRPKVLALFFFLGSALRIRTTSAFAPSSRSRTTRPPSAGAPRHTGHSVLSASEQDDDAAGDGSTLASDVRRALLASSLAAVTYNVATLGSSALGLLPAGYDRVSPLQFVAALGDPKASSGGGAERWGLWPVDPGPRGLRLREYERMRSESSGGGNGGDDLSGQAAASYPWLDAKDFFLDENAIIMPKPQFPLPPGKYLVTGARAVTTGLTVGADGSWELDEGKLYDVTHLPCRAARYRRAEAGDGSPSTVRKGDFPVAPGGIMPDVPGTEKEIYSVLFIVGKASV